MPVPEDVDPAPEPPVQRRALAERITLAPWLANAIVIAVLLVWLVNFFAPFFIPTYRPDPQLNFLFMGIAGGALGLKAWGSSGAGEPGPDADPAAQEDTP